MASEEFWNLFVGEKILIYQEDSIIFKSNINDFIRWDYIGAPWPKNQNDNLNCVGNGGFSLRTKQCMIDVINKISIEDTQFESSTINYMLSSGMTIGPEDVYFSLNMIRYDIGKVADWDSAFNFSTESINNPNSLGGHNFWISDKNWKKRLYDNIIIQFKPHYYIDSMEHRGGWKSIIEKFSNDDFFSDNSNIDFYDMVDVHFIIKDKTIIKNNWIGIVHLTPKTPDFLNIINLNRLFEIKEFIESMKNCIGIITLSTYITNFMIYKFKEYKFNCKIFTLKHPVIDGSEIPKFDLEKYINNKNKKIIQIGQQLRKVTSIYILKVIDYKKIWLTGTKDFERCKRLINSEINFFGLHKEINDNVEMKYTDTFEEYDNLLTDNIVFIDLFDSAANNVLLECIIRNTPIILNRTEGVLEYLGHNYPLYFDNLNEVPLLLNLDKIKLAYNYLQIIDKNQFSIELFTKNIFTISNNVVISSIKKYNIGIIINSCKQYNNAIPSLINNLLKMPINKENILIISGQEDEEEIININNIKIIKVKYSGSNLTGLIYLSENIDKYQNIDFWIFLPDTIEIGQNFGNLITNYINNINHKEYIYTIPFINPKIRPTMDLGIYTNKHILNMKDYYQKIKTYDCSYENLILIKRQQIYNENISVGLSPHTTIKDLATKFNYYDKNFSENKINQFLVNSHAEIIEEQLIIDNKKINKVKFVNLDLVKIQRNFTGPDNELVINY
jgi:hypothetical protein